MSNLPKVLESLDALYETSFELHSALERAREAISDEDWDAFLDGPLGEVLCAAMDVEYHAEILSD